LLLGLKSQHVTSLSWLAEVTDAETEGLSVGSHTLIFIPRLPPTELAQRQFKISAEAGAASTLLILQAIFPFLLFASNESNEPIFLDISGGTNVAFSLSFEYLDQVLLPTLEERFGIVVERELKVRGWSLGRQSRGSIKIKIQPVPRGEKLRYRPPPARRVPESYSIGTLDVSIIAPVVTHASLQAALMEGLNELYPSAQVRFKNIEDSRDPARLYMLVVASSVGGIRWGRDILSSQPKKVKNLEVFLQQLAKRLCKELHEEISLAGDVDEHLQDQLVCFQALSDGLSTFPRRESGADGLELSSAQFSAETMDKLAGETRPGQVRRDDAREPFGHGTMHTKTARWVVAELLPGVEFYRKGDVVRGIGTSLG
jgi:RNA 3'-terminal phosphate cyclase (ATP)